MTNNHIHKGITVYVTKGAPEIGSVRVVVNKETGVEAKMKVEVWKPDADDPNCGYIIGELIEEEK
jgi:hypothetical protein